MLIRTPSSQQIVDHGWHGWSHRGSCSLWRCCDFLVMVLRREQQYQYVTRQHVTNIMGPPAHSINREDQLISQAILGTRSCYRSKTSKPRRGAKCHPGNKATTFVTRLSEPGQKADRARRKTIQARSGRTLPTDPARMAMNWQQELLAQTIAAVQPAAKKVSAPIAHIPTNPSADRVDPRPFLPQSPLVRSIDPPDADADRSRRSFPEQEGERGVDPCFQGWSQRGALQGDRRPAQDAAR